MPLESVYRGLPFDSIPLSLSTYVLAPNAQHFRSRHCLRSWSRCVQKAFILSFKHNKNNSLGRLERKFLKFAQVAVFVFVFVDALYISA